MNRFQVMAVTGAVAGMTALSSVGVASAQDAVQWRVQDGGNGHWYEARVTQATIAWSDARAQAVANGADLAKAGSATSLQWLFELSAAKVGAWKPFGSSWLGPWLGGRQQVGASEPNGGWIWGDGTPINLAATRCVLNNSSGCGVNEDRLLMWKPSSAPISASTNDYETSDFPDRGYCEPQFPRMTSFIIEYSADCNSDGIVDYGQIRAGELVDANANNVPDCCEESTSCSTCPGDIDESGTVNGVDLAAILAVWGSDGGKYPRADTNNDGEVNGADLATVLGSWGPCE